MINDLISSRQGVIIISIIWGLGLSALFRKVCKGRDCIVIQAPNTKEIEKKMLRKYGRNYKAR